MAFSGAAAHEIVCDKNCNWTVDIILYNLYILHIIYTYTRKPFICEPVQTCTTHSCIKEINTDLGGEGMGGGGGKRHEID